MPRPDAVVRQRVAGDTAHIDLLAVGRIRRRVAHRRGQRQPCADRRGNGLHAMKADGTGASPRALRRTAPCSSLAANFSTSACDFSWSTGKLYLALAATGLPPSFITVLDSTSACSLWWPWKVTARSSTGFSSSLLSAPS